VNRASVSASAIFDTKTDIIVATFSNDTIKGWNLKFSPLWSCELSSVLPKDPYNLNRNPRAKSERGEISIFFSVGNRRLSAQLRISSNAFLLGLDSGELLLFELPFPYVTENRNRINILKETFLKLDRDAPSTSNNKTNTHDTIRGQNGTTLTIIKQFSSPVSILEEISSINVDDAIKLQKQYDPDLFNRMNEPSQNAVICIAYVCVSLNDETESFFFFVGDSNGFVHCLRIMSNSSKLDYYLIDEFNISTHNIRTAILQIKACALSNGNIHLHYVDSSQHLVFYRTNVKNMHFNLIGYSSFEGPSTPSKLEIDYKNMNARIYGEGYWTDWQLGSCDDQTDSKKS